MWMGYFTLMPAGSPARLLALLVAALGLVPCASVCAGQTDAEIENLKVKGAAQGQVVLLTNLWSQRREMPVLPVTITPREGCQLLFSDRPEYFRSGDGIALQEEVKPGRVRLYIYHVPEPAGVPKVVSSVIENLGTNDLRLRFQRHAFPKPGRNYLEIGKQGLIDYFEYAAHPDHRRLAPHERMAIDPAMDRVVAMSPELVHGFYEFEIDQPALISVFQRSPAQASTNAVEVLRKIPLSDPAGAEAAGAGRGLFLTDNYEVGLVEGAFLDSTNGPVQLIVADGKRDPWIKGHDSISDGEESLDKGNYGVIYHIRFPYRTSDGRGLALLAYNPHGPQSGCGQMAMALRVGSGEFPGGVVAVPKERISFGGRNQMVLIQRFPPLREGAEGIIEIDYSPPGASCLPTPLVFVPYAP